MISLTSLTTRTISVVALSLLVSCTAAAWLLVKPAIATGSTYVMFASLVLAAGAIVINTWHNAQAPTSTSQLIYATEVAPPSPR